MKKYCGGFFISKLTVLFFIILLLAVSLTEVKALTIGSFVKGLDANIAPSDCGDNNIVNAISNNNVYSGYRIQYLTCNKTISTNTSAGLKTLLTSTRSVLDSSVSQDSFFCNEKISGVPAIANITVCGIAERTGCTTGPNPNPDNGAECAIDQLYCCETNDFNVNYNDYVALTPTSKSQHMVCPSDHPVMCGAANSASNTLIQTAYCCAIISELGNLCFDKLDNDGDGQIDGSDTDCDGSISSSGQVNNIAGENSIALCNDAFDNDYDNIIDMNDTDCQQLPATLPKIAGSDSMIFSLFLNQSLRPKNIYASSSNGSDAMCGDDYPQQARCYSYDASCSSKKDEASCAASGCIVNYSYSTYTTTGFNSTSCTSVSDAPNCNGADTQISQISGYATCCDAFWTCLISSNPIDPCNSCKQTLGINTKPPNQIPITTSRTCQVESFNNCLAPVAASCDIQTTKSTCLAQTGCLWENLSGTDSGYVSFGTNYFCYYKDPLLDLWSTTNLWTWFDSGNKRKIYIVNLSDVNYDFISNGDNWTVCDAKGNIPATNAIKIKEGQSFPLPETKNIETMNCYALAQVISDSLGASDVWSDCSTNNRPCCFGTANLSKANWQDSCDCRNVDNIDLRLCDYFSTSPYCGGSPGNNGASNGDILGTGDENTVKDPFGGGFNYYKPDLNCYEYEADPKYKDSVKLCLKDSTHDEICAVGGIVKITPDTKNTNNTCCFGVNSCIDRTQITSSTCENEGGTLMPNNGFVLCSPSAAAVKLISDPLNPLNSQSCCFGSITYSANGLLYNFHELDNKNYVCYSDDNKQKFAECCYQNCNNYFPVGDGSDSFVDSKKGRVFGAGSSVFTVASFDRYISSDNYQTGTFNNRYTYTTIGSSGKRKIFDTLLDYADNFYLQNYSYLELDFKYGLIDNLGVIQNIYINDVDFGNLWKYSSDMNKQPLIWHHLTIPISMSGILKNISVTIAPGSYSNNKFNISYNNIRFAPKSTMSNNYFCTNTFASWVSDLDPPSGIPQATFDSDDGYVTLWGKHMTACNAQTTFGWTGHQCCGDDTKILPNGVRNYGEFFTDYSPVNYVPGAGCFGGREVFNGQSVAEAFGYFENISTNFDDFTYDDLLFVDGQFYSCQAPDSKYANLFVSYDGNTPTTNIRLVPSVNIFNNQCVVKGNYFCQNGAWKQMIQGYGQTRTESTNYVVSPSIPSGIEYKSAPLGNNLIYNGGFDIQ